MPLIYIVAAAFIMILLLALVSRIVRESAVATLIVNTISAAAFAVMMAGLLATQFGGTL